MKVAVGAEEGSAPCVAGSPRWDHGQCMDRMLEWYWGPTGPPRRTRLVLVRRALLAGARWR